MWRDFHLIPDPTGGILFFPMTYRLFRVGQAEGKMLTDFLTGKIETVPLGALREVIAAEAAKAEAIRAQEKAFSSPPPETDSLCLYVAHDCNLRCSYCYNQQGRATLPGRMMEPAVAEAAFRRFFTTPGKRYGVAFYGGEPLLNFRAIKEIVALGRRLEMERGIGTDFSMTTNGTVMNREIEDFLAKEFDTVTVSLDGPAETHDRHRKGPKGGGSHARALATIRRLQARGKPRLTVNGVLTPDGLQDYSRSLAYLENLGTQNAALNPLRTPSTSVSTCAAISTFVEQRANDCAAAISEGLRKNSPVEALRVVTNLLTKRKLRRHCRAGFNPAVGADGTLYACHGLVETDFAMGTLTEPENEKFRTIQKSFVGLTVDHIPACAACWTRYFCGGACYAQNVEQNSSLSQPAKQHCQWVKHCTEASVREFLAVSADEEKRKTLYDNVRRLIGGDGEARP